MDKGTAYRLGEEYIAFLINEKKYDIKKAYLFGSYANETQRNESDIDIAVVMADINDIIDLQIQLMFLRRRFSVDIEPHPIKEEDFTISNPLAFEIMQTGIEFQLKKL
jgi:predicted nucleotidyltransferase